MSPLELAPDDIVADRYRIERKLGEGGMGQVYLVQHTKTEERFALKILNPAVAETDKARERFRREARTPARIDSDHVCRVVDSDLAPDLDDAPFLVLEYLRGEDLGEISRRVGPLPPSEVALYLGQVARTLDKAHALGIVHRDLKPENLFLTMREDGTPCVKVLDFGIAKLTGASSDIPEMKATATGDVFGTPLFMSPEQCKSESEKISPQTDVWALGLITFRLLTGEDFWTATTLTHLIAQVAYEDIPTPSDRGAELGSGYDAWFARCCHRDVEARFRSAGEAIDGLWGALDLSPDTAEPVDLLGVNVAREAFASLADPPSTNVAVGDADDASISKTTPAITVERTDPGRGRRWVPVAAIGALLVGGSAGLWFGPDPSSPTVPAASSPDEVLAAPSVGMEVEQPVPSAMPSAVRPSRSARPTPTASSTAPLPATPPPPRPVPVQQRAWPRPPPPVAPTPPPPPPPVDPLDSRR